MPSRRTLAKPFSLAGTGLHSGEPCAIEAKPAPSGTGVTFLVGNTTIPARAEHVVDTARCTAIGKSGVWIGTVEHLMAALMWMGVDDCLVEASGPEVPVLDGSALPFVKEIARVGTKEQEGEAEVLTIAQPLWVHEEQTYVMALPGPGFLVTCLTDFDYRGLASRLVQAQPDAQVFADELAPARTFGFEYEAELVLRMGMAKGANLDNCLLIGERGPSRPYRLEDEPTRHKMVDLLGDLALLGARLEGAIVAVRPSHRANVRLAQKLAQVGKRKR